MLAGSHYSRPNLLSRPVGWTSALHRHEQSEYRPGGLARVDDKDLAFNLINRVTPTPKSEH
jgi:hypothetical protein